MLPKPHDILVTRLKGFGHARKRLRLAAAACTWLCIALAVSAAYVIIDWLLEPGVIPLLVLLGIATLAILVLLLALVLPAVFRRVRLEREAVAAESLVGSLRNRLVTTLQMAGEVGLRALPAIKINVSPALIAAVADQAVRDLDEHRPESLIDRKPARQRAVAAGVLLVLAIGFSVWQADVLRARYRRVQQAYVAVIDMIWPVVAHVSPENKTVLREETVELGVRIEGRPFENVRLQRRQIAEEGVEALPPKSLPLKDGVAGFRSGRLQETFDYWFEYGERQTKKYRIRVVDRPALERVRVDLDYPAYTKRLPRTFMGRVPIVRALKGTRVTLSLTYNKDIADAAAVWESGPTEPWDTTGRYVGTEFLVTNSDSVQMAATCVDEYLAEEKFELRVIAEQDERPTIVAHVKSPRQGSIMLTVEQLPLFSVGFTATDDFGVSSVALVYEKTGTDRDLATEKIKDSIPKIIQPARDRVVGAFPKCFQGLSVQSGDKITFHLEATDNREVATNDSDVEKESHNTGRTPRKYSIVIYQPRMTSFLDERLQEWAEGLRLWGGVERAGKGRTITMPTAARRVSESPKLSKEDVKTSVTAERIPGASRKAEAQFRELMARWRRGGEE